MEQVAITGVGVISALGSGFDSFTEGLDTGRWVVEPAPWADPPSGRHAWNSPVSSFDPARWIDERVRSGTDLFAQYALAAAAQAVQDHGADLEPERTGVVIGTTMAGAGSLVEAQRLLDTKGPQAVPRKLNIQAWPNMAAGQIALRWRLHGPLLTVSTACASGLDAIGTAAEMIESGRADVVIAGGTERGLSEVLYHSQTAYGMSGAVSDPALATMPFDRRRSGLVEGEGAAVVVLERADRARARGARVYGLLRGYASLSDGYHPSSPDPSGRWEAEAKAGRSVDARVINTSSPSGLYGNVGQANYGAAKAGIAAFTVIAATELARYGVTVNAIAPGARTRMTEDLAVLDGARADGDGFDAMAPENVSPLVVWLGGPHSAGVTGRVFNVWGGRISVAEGWRAGPGVDKGARWEVGELTEVVPGLVERAAPNANMWGEVPGA